MEVDGRLVNLEIQVANEGDYELRSLFYGCRLFSSGLPAGGDHAKLPSVIVISILDFKLFDCEQYFSSYHMWEDTQRAVLTRNLSMRYFELPKLPSKINAENEKELFFVALPHKN
jgi:predicted transposase/invertase (TIGR01784 family)